MKARKQPSYICSLLGVLLLSLAGGAIATASDQKSEMSNQELSKILSTEKFSEIRSVKSIPAAVLNLYLKESSVHNPSKIFADPGKPWQSSCGIDVNGPPTKSLILAAASSNCCLVYYQQGGFVLLDKIDMFTIDASGNAKRAWSSSMFAEKPESSSSLVETAKKRIIEGLK